MDLMKEFQIEKLVKNLLQYQESEWLEFTKDNEKPEKIGQNISAMSNSLALLDRAQGYMLWGVDNKSKTLLGTKFQPKQYKVGNEELENWLSKSLEPGVDLRIYEGTVDEKKIVLFTIDSALDMPTSFHGIEYIRIGSYTRKLKDHPEKEDALMQLLIDNL